MIGTAVGVRQSYVWCSWCLLLLGAVIGVVVGVNFRVLSDVPFFPLHVSF